MDLIAQDKKVKRGKLTFILARGIGAGLHRAATSMPREVRAFLDEKLGNERPRIVERLSCHRSAAPALPLPPTPFSSRRVRAGEVRGFRIDALAEENRFGARLVQQMMRDIEAYLACCQLGITMASLGLGWVGEPTVAALLGPAAEPLGMPRSALHFTAFMVGFLLFSSLHIVIGEQVPKTLAIREPEPVSLWSPIRCTSPTSVLFPLNWLLNAASRSILRMLGVRDGSHQEILTDVEIEGLVEVSAEHGKMEVRQAEFIHNVFRFGELAVSDVMVHRTDMSRSTPTSRPRRSSTTC